MVRVVRGLSVSFLTVGLVIGTGLVGACKARVGSGSAVQEGQDGSSGDDIDALLGKLETETRLYANDLAMDTGIFEQSGTEGLALDDQAAPAPMTQAEVKAKIDMLQTEFTARLAIYDGKDAAAGARIKAIVADMEKLKALLPTATAEQTQQAEKVVTVVQATQTQTQQSQAEEQAKQAEQRRQAAEQQAQQQAQQVAQEEARQQAERESESSLRQSYPRYTRVTKSGRGKSTFFVAWPVGAAIVTSRKSGDNHMSVNFKDTGWGTFESIQTDSLAFNGHNVNSGTTLVTSSGNGFTVEVGTDNGTSWEIELAGPGIGAAGPIGSWGSGSQLVTNVRFFKKGDTVTARGEMTSNGHYYVKGALVRVHPERESTTFWSNANDRSMSINGRTTIPKSGFYLLHIKIEPDARIRTSGNVTLSSP